MNKLHIALLSASMIFSASVFCSQNQTPAGTPPTGTNVAGTPPATPQAPGYLKQTGDFVVNMVKFFPFTVSDKISDYTATPVLNTIASTANFLNFECLAKKANNKVGRAIVWTTAAVVAYLVYTNLIAQQNADTDNEDFFVQEEVTE